jgi:hypothetical protein
MDNKREGYPNITLEQAKDILTRLQRRVDEAVNQKYKAQNIAFDLLFPDFKCGDIETLKAQVCFYKIELDDACLKRDKVKCICEELRAENNLLKAQLKTYEKGLK